MITQGRSASPSRAIGRSATAAADKYRPERSAKIWFGTANPPELANQSAAAASSQYRWPNTGELGYCDDGGYLYQVDCQGNVVTLDGSRYFPEQIEHLQISHPRVADIAKARPDLLAPLLP